MPVHRHRISALPNFKKVGEFERPELNLAKAVCQALTQLTADLSKPVERLDAPPTLIIAAIMAAYLVLGCVIES